MRRVTILVITMLLAAACGAKPAALPLTPSVLPASEAAVYDVLSDTGENQGKAIFSVVREGDLFHFGSDTVFTGGVEDKTDSWARADTLAPVRGTHALLGAGQSNFTLTSTYENGKLNVAATTSQGDKSNSRDVPAGAIDNDALLMSLRTLPFAANYTVTIVDSIPGTLSTADVKITVTGEDNLDTPAGKYAVWKVELNVSGTLQYVWYDKAGSHVMVRYENPAAKRAFVLESVNK